VIAVVLNPPDIKMCILTANIVSQKLPCPEHAKTDKKHEINAEIEQIQPLTIGFLFSNLSPINPVSRFEMKPNTANITAPNKRGPSKC
jgi:hypothetical protein